MVDALNKGEKPSKRLMNRNPKLALGLLRGACLLANHVVVRGLSIDKIISYAAQNISLVSVGFIWSNP